MSRYSVDIRHLRYFATIAEAGSFTRAATLLHIAQPALSQHVRNLELAFSVQLFDRRARGVNLTPEGMKLLTHARRVLAEMDTLMDAVTSGPPQGDVSLGLPVPVSPLVIQPLMTIMQREYGDVSLHITEGMSAHIAEWLIDGRLDAAVLFGTQESPHLDCHEICVEPVYLLGPPGAFAAGDAVPFRDLHRFPLIMTNKQNGLRDLVHKAALEHGIDYVVKFEIDVISEIKQFVERGLGYTILAPIAFHQELLAGRLSAAPIVDPEIGRVLTLATRTSSNRNPASRVVTDLTASILVERTKMIADTVSAYAAAVH
ncbi:MAG: LysR family transcriptional regulator [Aquisalimonadaceae bacterium]